MKMVLTTAPTALPVTVAEVRDACQLLYQGDDARLTQMIYAAVAYLDGMDGILGRAIMPQTWTLFLDTFPAAVDLPLPPFRAISSVTYNDTAAVATVLPTTEYRAVGVNPATVFFAATPIAAADDRAGNVEIKYEAGYTNLPQSLRYAIMALIRHWYDNPGVAHVGMTAMQHLPLAVDALLAPYKVQRI